MELSKIINARNLLSSFTDREDLGTYLSYWMAKFIAETQNEHQFYLNEMQRLLEKYAVHSDDGEQLIPKEKLPDFYKEVDLLDRTDVKDPGVRFNLSELSNGLSLSMKQIYHLLDFVKEDA